MLLVVKYIKLACTALAINLRGAFFAKFAALALQACTYKKGKLFMND
jgi:hypothetical protein